MFSSAHIRTTCTQARTGHWEHRAGGWFGPLPYLKKIYIYIIIIITIFI